MRRQSIPIFSSVEEKQTQRQKTHDLLSVSSRSPTLSASAAPELLACTGGSVKCLPLTEPSLPHSKDVINFPHYPVGPLDGSGNHCLRLRAPTIVEQVFGRLEMTGDQNPGDNCQHAFASLIHCNGDFNIFAFCSSNQNHDRRQHCTPKHKTSKMNT